MHGCEGTCQTGREGAEEQRSRGGWQGGTRMGIQNPKSKAQPQCNLSHLV